MPFVFARISGAIELTYGEVLYDYFVFVTFVPSPMILTSGMLKLVSTQMKWSWGWKQRAVLGIAGSGGCAGERPSASPPPATPVTTLVHTPATPTTLRQPPTVISIMFWIGSVYVRPKTFNITLFMTLAFYAYCTSTFLPNQPLDHGPEVRTPGGTPSSPQAPPAHFKEP